MKHFMKTIIVFSLLIVLLSVLDFLDHHILNIFPLQNNAMFQLTFDVITLIFELSLLFGH